MNSRERSGGASAVAAVDTEKVRRNIIRALKTVYDPEIPINVYDLGLIYEIDVQPDGVANIKMTLTAPGCPEAEYLQTEVQAAAQAADDVRAATVELVWDPPWTLAQISDDGKRLLGMK